jgi:hypothetical protein
MPIATFTAPRISNENETDLKRSLERALTDVSSAVEILQDGIDNHYTTEPPDNVTPFKKILVHEDHAATFIEPPLPAFTAKAAVFTWYIDPIPERMVGTDNNGQWVLLYEVPAI